MLYFRPQAARNPSYFLSRDAGGILSLHHKGSAGVIYVGVKGEMGHARQPGAEGSWRDRQLPWLCVSVRALYFLAEPFFPPLYADGSGPSTQVCL